MAAREDCSTWVGEEPRRRFLFYDVISFFQCAFVKACDSYRRAVSRTGT